MSLISALKEAPANLSTASTFTWISGALYMATGALVMAWPAVVQTVFLDPDFVGHEATLMRVLGMTVMVIGWLYVFGGRSGGRQFLAATILDRVILVPLVLVPIAMSGVIPHTLLLFAVLDPTLAIVTWWLMAKQSK